MLEVGNRVTYQERGRLIFGVVVAVEPFAVAVKFDGGRQIIAPEFLFTLA